jgi:hypothetical protein
VDWAQQILERKLAGARRLYAGLDAPAGPEWFAGKRVPAPDRRRMVEWMGGGATVGERRRAARLAAYIATLEQTLAFLGSADLQRALYWLAINFPVPEEVARAVPTGEIDRNQAWALVSSCMRDENVSAREAAKRVAIRLSDPEGPQPKAETLRRYYTEVERKRRRALGS